LKKRKAYEDEMMIKTEINKWCQNNLIPWRCPKEIGILDEMPRTKIGKIAVKEIETIYGTGRHIENGE